MKSKTCAFEAFFALAWAWHKNIKEALPVKPCLKIVIAQH